MKSKTALDGHGWLGVDLDGTLAVQQDPFDGSIGPPIPAMVRMVRKAIMSGRDVRVFTARASVSYWERRKVRAWLRRHLGYELPVTCVKDMMCEEIWDDRARQVVFNEGRFA